MSRRSHLRRQRLRIQRQQARQHRQQHATAQAQEQIQEQQEVSPSLWNYGSVADNVAVLHDSRATNTLRYGAAQHIGHTLGNSALQRLAAATPSSSPTLRLGSSGAAVQELQSLLNNSGAEIAADGIFGKKTRQTVVRFQKAAGLASDGIVGRMTWGSLRAGGVTIEPVQDFAPVGAAAGNPASKQLVIAKLNEIKTYMRDIGKASPLSAMPDLPEIETATAVPVVAEHSHDSADGEEETSWWDDTKAAANDAYNTVSDAAGEAWDSTKEAANDAYNTVSDAAGEAWDSASEAAGEAWDQTQQVVGSVQENVNQGVDWVVNQAQTISNEVGTVVDEFTEDVKQQFGETVAAVEEFVNDVAYYLANSDEALQKLEDILNDLKQKAREIFGGEPSEDTPNEIFVNVPGSEAAAEATVCHDSPLPLVKRPRTRKLRLNLAADTSSTQTDSNGIPKGSFLNHDRVVPTFTYKSDVGMNDDRIAKVPKDDFGTTGATISIKFVSAHAKRFTDFVDVSAIFQHYIAWQITNSPGRTDVPANLEGIDETNWKKAADDLDPDLHKTDLGAPRRAEFWAKDITEGHEKFHVADGEKYVAEKVLPAIKEEYAKREIEVPWIFGRDEDVAKQVRAINEELTKKSVQMRNEYMNKGGENRAYANDEPAYRARAKAIREKAKKEGWDAGDKKKK